MAGNAMGAVALIRWWTRLNLWLAQGVNRPLAAYIQHHHPELHRRVRGRLGPTS